MGRFIALVNWEALRSTPVRSTHFDTQFFALFFSTPLDTNFFSWLRLTPFWHAPMTSDRHLLTCFIILHICASSCATSPSWRDKVLFLSHTPPSSALYCLFSRCSAWRCIQSLLPAKIGQCSAVANHFPHKHTAWTGTVSVFSCVPTQPWQ